MLSWPSVFCTSGSVAPWTTSGYLHARPDSIATHPLLQWCKQTYCCDDRTTSTCRSGRKDFNSTSSAGKHAGFLNTKRLTERNASESNRTR